jgi:hypothetical protein
MSDSTNIIPQVSQSAVQRETLINQLIAELSGPLAFARDPTTTTALTWGYLGGRVDGTSFATGTVALTASNTNYLVAHRTTLAVTVSTATTNWTNTAVYARLYKIVASTATVTSYEDHRFGATGILAAGAGGSSTSGITINAQTGTTYTVLSTDQAKLVTHSNAASIAVTLPQATGSFTTPFYYYTTNLGVGAVTITPTTSTINGAATLVLNTGESAIIVSDGTNYQIVWINKRPLVNAQTGTTYTYLAGDSGKLVTHTNASAIAGTLPQGTGAFGVGFSMRVQNRGAGTLTITPTTSTIDGAANLVLRTGQGAFIQSDGTNYFTERGMAQMPKWITVAVSDETTALTTGTAKLTFRMPFAMTLTEVRANINTTSSSGLPTVDVNEAGSTILSTKITIDVGELTSVTAATVAPSGLMATELTKLVCPLKVRNSFPEMGSQSFT